MTFRKQFELGITEFNGRKFFECHDTFEDLWMHERGERKRFLQGLIQGSVGIFHATRGNFAGADSQLTKALQKLDGYSETYLGVDLVNLRQGLREFQDFFRRSIAAGELKYNSDLIPTIRYTFDPETMDDVS